MKKEEDQGQCSSSSQAINNIQSYQEQLLLHQMMRQHQQQPSVDVFGGNSSNNNNNNTNNERGLMFPEVSPIFHPPPPPQPPWSLPPVHSFNPVRDSDQQFLVPPPSSSLYAGLFNRRAPSLQFAYDGPSNSDHHHLRIISDTLGVGPVVGQPGSAPFGLQAELGKMTAQEIMDAKALAASKSHSEAERRRRERINNHLAKLRSLLPNTTKTDKASLLAEVIQHVKELKRQTSIIAETSPVPTETDELTVDDASDEEGRFVIKASLCCEDRSDLLPDLIKTLKALRLRTVKAEITTLGGRVKNVLFVTGEEDDQFSGGGEEQGQHQHCISSIQEALKAVMEKNGGGDENGNVKRQRTNNNINILEQNRSL
ncbi:transcription factor bHLH30-like [Neltuma alba]|uniref:transcription factor bHLH30-like n=1 Tax=Neltuma alba TaxID=207710 RepID=UPI0010A56CB5|nr:transcription factor bHLH30-like [Prosopis alba]XP_028789302.1 transcription factor bHLH30-like [Prosopis alba]